MKAWMLVGLLALGTSAVTTPVTVSAQQQPATKVCTLKVNGMTCEVCTTAVKLAAKKIDGVKDAVVSYKNGTADITYDPAKTTPDAIAKIVTEKSGFKAAVQARK